MKQSAGFRLSAGLAVTALIAVGLAVVGSVPSLAGKNDKAKAEVASYQDRIAAGRLEVATLGSGCFWCTESDFDKVPGVKATISGYMGGDAETIDYSTVSTGRTKFIEVLHVVYDPKVVTYDKLLYFYWRTTDVVDGTGQFCDRGTHYAPVIFAHGQDQLTTARAQKAELDASGKLPSPIAVQIAPAKTFIPAEDYHQDYYEKNPLRYKSYRYGCGRDQRLRRLWGSEALTN